MTTSTHTTNMFTHFVDEDLETGISNLAEDVTILDYSNIGNVHAMDFLTEDESSPFKAYLLVTLAYLVFLRVLYI